MEEPPMPEQSSPDSQKAGTLGAANDASLKQAEGGITNRPLDREEHEQERLPPRAKAKESGDA
jgi:hypothetical protein